MFWVGTLKCSIIFNDRLVMFDDKYVSMDKILDVFLVHKLVLHLLKIIWHY